MKTSEATIERPAVAGGREGQIRCGRDGISWSSWRHLMWLDEEEIPFVVLCADPCATCPYIQARIIRSNGEIESTSQIDCSADLLTGGGDGDRQ